MKYNILTIHDNFIFDHKLFDLFSSTGIDIYAECDVWNEIDGLYVTWEIDSTEESLTLLMLKAYKGLTIKII